MMFGCTTCCCKGLGMLAAIGLLGAGALLMTAAGGGAPGDQPTAKAEVGKPAPAFTLTDIDGKEHRLSAYKGKVVVLEWFNPVCPYVVEQHKNGPLKDCAAKCMKDGVVWLAINSGAPGEQGTGAEMNKEFHAKWSMASPILLDEAGDVGRSYGATNTPHMYVINGDGILAYMGAIDNAPYGKVKGGETFINYVTEAIKQIKAGETVAISKTKAYGCNVKYGKGR